MWRAYECSHLVCVLRDIVLGYYSSLIKSCPGLEMIFYIAIFESCVCAVFSFLHSALVVRSAGSVATLKVFIIMVPRKNFFHYLRGDKTFDNQSNVFQILQISL